MFRKILAGLLALAGLAAATVGILSATVYRPSDTVTATMDAPTTPILLIEPGVFPLVADEVTMVVTAPSPEDPIAIISSPSYDVEAWVGPAAVTRVTGLADWETLATTVTEGEATVPDPVGADLWRTETTATGEYSAIITDDPGPVTVLLATDGTKPAPSLTLTWPVDVVTPYLVPLLVGGGVLLLAAIALAFAGRKPAIARASESPAAKRNARPGRLAASAAEGEVPAKLTRRQLRELERQRLAENPRLDADGPVLTTAGAVGAGVVPGVLDPERYRALRHVQEVEDTDVLAERFGPSGPAAGASVVPGVADTDRYRYAEAKDSGPAAGAGIVPGVANSDRYRYAEATNAGPAAGAAIVPGVADAGRFRQSESAETPARTSWRDLWGMKKTEEQR